MKERHNAHQNHNEFYLENKIFRRYNTVFFSQIDRLSPDFFWSSEQGGLSMAYSKTLNSNIKLELKIERLIFSGS